MASRTSATDWDGAVIDMAELGARLARRKAELGLTEDEICSKARNPGTNRTPSKRALLKAIEDLGGKW